VLAYRFALDDRNDPPRRYFTTWCDGMAPDALAILRWQKAN
jgi:hypothetical protein